MAVALDRVDPDFPLCRDGEDFHAVEHGTSDPGQLADDQDIIGPEPNLYADEPPFVRTGPCVDIEQPFDDKQWAFDAANLTQGEC